MKAIRLFTACLFLFLSAALYCQTKSANDTMHWRASKPLSWGDFKGKPKKINGMRGEAFCMNYSKYEKPNPLKKTKYKVFAIWDKSKSWIDPNSKTTEELLYYQTLFNIYEVNARKLRKEFSETKFGINPDAVFEEKYNASNAALIDECDQYKEETQAGTSEEAVKKWDAKIKAELKELQQYPE